MSGSRVRRFLVAAGGLAVLLAGCTTEVDGVASAARTPTPPTDTGFEGETPVEDDEDEPFDEDEPVEEPVWEVEALLPTLRAYADDETEDWAAFDPDAVVHVPCGGQGAHGLPDDVVETTAGGNFYGASAEVFADAEQAADELDRLAALLADCDGPYDYVSASTGEVLTACEEPDITSLSPVLQYLERCEIAAVEGAEWAVFRTGNAVVSVSAPGDEGLGDVLPDLLETLDADA